MTLVIFNAFIFCLGVGLSYACGCMRSNRRWAPKEGKPAPTRREEIKTFIWDASTWPKQIWFELRWRLL